VLDHGEGGLTMSFDARNLRALGNQIAVSMEPDEDGYLGRECPIETCLGYFKITVGTGVKGPAPCHCPYCGHVGDHKTFWTREQIDYARSMAIRKVTDAVRKDLKSLEFEHKPKGPFGIGISLKLQPGSPHPIQYYREKELETHVVCANCTLRYAIYGVFGWCPDCGVHNSSQILSKNLELAQKEIALAETVDKDLAEHLLGDALENVVSVFDGFGRVISEQKGRETRFQNLSGARRNIEEAFGFDFADVLSEPDWKFISRMFQKRHLISHKMGVIDEDYIAKADDPDAVVGRKVQLQRDEVENAIGIVRKLGDRLYAGIFQLCGKTGEPNVDE
jgi:hypothetical protein